MLGCGGNLDGDRSRPSQPHFRPPRSMTDVLRNAFDVLEGSSTLDFLYSFVDAIVAMQRHDSARSVASSYLERENCPPSTPCFEKFSLRDASRPPLPFPCNRNEHARVGGIIEPANNPSPPLAFAPTPNRTRQRSPAGSGKKTKAGKEAGC